MSTPATTPSSRRGQIMQTYQMAKRSDPRIGLILMGVVRARRRHRLRAHVVAAGRRHDRLDHVDRRRAPGRPARRAARLRSPRPEGGVHPDGGPAGRRGRCAADAAPRLEGRPGRRLHQAAGRRAPRRRPARHRPGRRGLNPSRVKHCSPPSARSTSASPTASRSTRSSAAAARARSRCPSSSSTSRSSAERQARRDRPTSSSASRPSTPQRGKLPLPKGPVPTS